MDSTAGIPEERLRAGAPVETQHDLAMKSVHHMIHQGERADGGVEWGCPRCGRYMIYHPLRHLVVLLGEAGTVHLRGAPFPSAAIDATAQTDFDRHWLADLGVTW